MTDQEINKVIAEACGWENVHICEPLLKGNIVTAPPWYNKNKKMWMEWVPWDEI